MLSIIKKVDNYLLKCVNKQGKSDVLDSFMVVVTKLGNWGTVWIVTALILIIQNHMRQAGITILVSLIISTIFCEAIIKNIFNRKRPFLIKKDLDRLYLTGQVF